MTMNDKKYSRIASITMLVFGTLLFFVATDGFQAFTVEQARVNELIEERPLFPEVTLEDSKGRTYPFSDFQGKFVMLTFIYTACTDVCPELEMNLAQVYQAIPKHYIGEDIVFLSISFDPERDDPETLAKYQDYFASDGETWRMARVTDEKELNRLLDEFGVIVIPDGYGNFQHNSAFYLVDPNGVLIDVMDYTKIEEASRKVLKVLEERDSQ